MTIHKLTMERDFVLNAFKHSKPGNISFVIILSNVKKKYKRNRSNAFDSQLCSMTIL